MLFATCPGMSWLLIPRLVATCIYASVFARVCSRVFSCLLLCDYLVISFWGFWGASAIIPFLEIIWKSFGQGFVSVGCVLDPKI